MNTESTAPISRLPAWTNFGGYYRGTAIAILIATTACWAPATAVGQPVNNADKVSSRPPQEKRVTAKEFNWGVETWLMGSSDFVVHFKEPGHVRITRIYGNLTAGPQPNHPEFSHLVRQTLASLVDVGFKDNDDDIEIVGTPKDRANQSIDRNFFSINVKETDSGTTSIPIEYNYTPGRPLTDNKMLLRVFNESYTSIDGIDRVSTKQLDSLNVEIHLVINYEADN